MNIKYISFVFVLCLSLVSTQASAGLFGSKIEKSINYELLDANLKHIESIPLAQTNALLALDAAMRGIKTKKIKKSLNVNIIGEQIDAIEDLITALSIKNVVIDNLGDTAGAASPFSGVMFMADDIGRSIQISFVMLITSSASGHDVQVLSLSPSFWGAPNMEVFIVPDKSIDGSIASSINNYSGLYEKIATKSLSVDQFPSGTHKYIAVVFFKSIIAPNVNVKVKLSKDKTGLSGDSEGNYFQVYEGGWIVAVKPFEGNLLQQQQWMKITFQSDKNVYPAMNEDEYLVGLFMLGNGR